jgi:hypothetical protein
MNPRGVSTWLVLALGWTWSALGASITSSNRDVLSPNTGAMPLAGVKLGGQRDLEEQRAEKAERAERAE